LTGTERPKSPNRDREAKAAQRRPASGPGAWAGDRFSISTALVFCAVMVAILGLGNPALPYRRGQVARADIRARVNFKVVDEDATREARDKAAAAAPNVYRTDRSSFDRAVEELREALTMVQGAADFDALEQARARALGITPEFFEAVKSAEGGGDPAGITAAVQEALDAVLEQGALSQSDAKLEQSRQADSIIIIHDSRRLRRRLSETIPAGRVPQALRSRLQETFGNAELTDALVGFIAPRLKSFLFRDEEETRKSRRAAESQVAEIEQVFYRGDTLVRRDSVIDRPELRILQKEHQTYLADVSAPDRALRLAGLAITILFIVWLFGIYTARYEPRVLARRIRMIVLMLLAVLIAAIARFFVSSPLSWYLIPLPLVAMAVAIAYDEMFALGYTLALGIIVGIAAGGDFALAVSLFLGGAVGVLALGRVTSRPRPFLAGLAAGAGMFVAAWGTGLLLHTDYRLTFVDSLYAFVNGGICGVLLTVLLPFIERAFNVVTDLSLLELADLNKPLLRRLALEAPGTYNHSLFVGNLADSAAEVIGANRLFARVGGYYHDIGKLTKPDYFVENHGPSPSRHYNLSPTMSALVIISHVKDGVEMARENGLPSALVDLIREHHGTTLVEYFYREAIDQADNSKKVSDQSFRYPGPKPRTKEAAIVMLADSVESASRTVTEPTPSRLESLVTDIVRKKLADGQFDECGITMADLRKIEISLTKSLAGIFHSRIKYPGSKE